MKGQTLLEALLVLAAIALIFSGIAVIITSSLSNAGYGKNQSLATQYAQDGVEMLRTFRNKDYASFQNYNGNYCLPNGATTLGAQGTCSIPNADNFIRSVVMERNGCGLDASKATVNVAWTDGKCTSGTYCHTSKLISCISTVNPVQFYSSPGGSTPIPTTTPQATPTNSPTSPVIQGFARYSDGTFSKSGPSGTTVTLIAQGVVIGVSYQLVVGTNGGNPNAPCSQNVTIINPSTTNSNGTINFTTGIINKPSGTWQVCFKQASPGQNVTNPATFVVQ